MLRKITVAEVFVWWKHDGLRPLRGQNIVNHPPETIPRDKAVALIAQALKISGSAAEKFLDKNFGPGIRIPVAELKELLKLIRRELDLHRRIRVRMQEIKKGGPDRPFRPEFTPTFEPGPTNDGPSLG